MAIARETFAFIALCALLGSACAGNRFGIRLPDQ